MAPPATLTGQDVGEAEGALTALLNQVLAGTNTGITRTQYLALRVLALRDPFPSPAALHDYLASQPQVGLDGAQVVPGSDRWGGNAKHHKLLKHPEALSNAILPGHHHCPAASSLLKAYDRLHFLRSKGPGEGRGPEWIADGYAAAGLGRGLGVTAGPAVLTYG